MAAPAAPGTMKEAILNKAHGWLLQELVAERSAVMHLLEVRQHELMASFDTQLRPLVDELLLNRPSLQVAHPGAEDKDSRVNSKDSRVNSKDSRVEATDTDATTRKINTADIEGMIVVEESSKRKRVFDGGWLEMPPAIWETEEFMRWTQNAVRSIQFEVFFGCLIILNAIILAIHRQFLGDQCAYLLGYPGAKDPNVEWPFDEEAFVILEWIFGIIINCEVLLKVVVLRRSFFADTWWNGFDLIICMIWCLDRINLVFLQLNPTILRLARMARLMRIVRVLRWLTLLDTLVLLVKSIKASTSVLCWALLLMIVVISLVAMTIGSILEPIIMDPEEDLGRRKMLYEEWGSYTRSMVTMFEITLANWGPPLRRLMDNVNEWWALFLLGYKLTVGFAVVQVIISTFIQQTFKTASRDEEVMIKEKASASTAYERNVTNLFKHLDESGDGELTLAEFSEAMQDRHVQTWFSAIEVEPEEAKSLFAMLDDGDGSIHLEEFVAGIKALKGNAKGSDMLMLKRDLKKNFKNITGIGDKVDVLTYELRKSGILTVEQTRALSRGDVSVSAGAVNVSASPDVSASPEDVLFSRM